MDPLYFEFSKDDKNAFPPFKNYKTDSGYDLVLIKKVKNYGDVILYDTGIKVRPPKGYYFDLVPRSSIIKTGHMLANSVGIIDCTYTGTIKVPLVKIHKDIHDLDLPQRLVQLIPRKLTHLEIKEVEDISNDTNRGDKGFGSSGHK